MTDGRMHLIRLTAWIQTPAFHGALMLFDGSLHQKGSAKAIDDHPGEESHQKPGGRERMIQRLSVDKLWEYPSTTVFLLEGERRLFHLLLSSGSSEKRQNSPSSAEIDLTGNARELVGDVNTTVSDSDNYNSFIVVIEVGLRIFVRVTVDNAPLEAFLTRESFGPSLFSNRKRRERVKQDT